jgi:hypothetical protein
VPATGMITCGSQIVTKVHHHYSSAFTLGVLLLIQALLLVDFHATIMKRALVLTLIVAHVCVNVNAGTVLLHDPSSKILHKQVTPSSVTQAASTGALCAATALVPPYNIADEAARQVSHGLSRPEAWDKGSTGHQAHYQFALATCPCRSKASCSTMSSTSLKQLCC